MNRRIALAALLIVLCCASAHADVLVDCYAGAQSSDFIYRGFYVTSYPGTGLARVELLFAATAAGEYTISLTARDGAYDGPVLGTAQTTLSLTGDVDVLAPATFDFADGTTVTAGSVVAFVLETVSGPTMPNYAVVTENAACPVVETENTDAPLSTPRRNGVRVRISDGGTTPTTDTAWGALKQSYR